MYPTKKNFPLYNTSEYVWTAPLAKEGLMFGNPFAALAWGLCEGKCIALHNMLPSVNVDGSVSVVLATYFSSHTTKNISRDNQTVDERIVATGYIKPNNNAEFDDNKVAVNLSLSNGYHFVPSEFINTSYMKNGEGHIYDVYSDSKCTVAGWNVNYDFFNALYTSEVSVETIRNTDVELKSLLLQYYPVQEDNSYINPIKGNVEREIDHFVEHYDSYIRPIIQYLRDNNIGIPDYRALYGDITRAFANKDFNCKPVQDMRIDWFTNDRDSNVYYGLKYKNEWIAFYDAHGVFQISEWNSLQRQIEKPFEWDTIRNLIDEIVNEVQNNKGGTMDNVQYTQPVTSNLSYTLEPDYERNVLISGTPGSGKSYFVDNFSVPAILKNASGCPDEIKKADMKSENYAKYLEAHKFRTTFTSSLTHDGFFGCYKPTVSAKLEKKEVEIEKNKKEIKFVESDTDKQVLYEFVPGIFCNALIEALNNPTENYVLIIEEMNRGHVYEILGDVFQLLDRDAQGKSQYPVKLPEDARNWFKVHGQDITEYVIPGNLYIIGTMNNADSRVEFLDTAFKRRFTMMYMTSEGYLYGSNRVAGVQGNNFKGYRSYQENIDAETYHRLRGNINKVLRSLGKPEDKLIARNFRKMDAGDRMLGVDFIVIILGYLLQNVFRGERELNTSIFNKDCEECKSVESLLEMYNGSISSILNMAEMNKPV